MACQRDRHAGLRIRELREDNGWNLEDLSYEISKGTPRYPASARTIRRVEHDGVIPTVRVKFGIAQAFGLLPSEIWRNVGHRVAA